MDTTPLDGNDFFLVWPGHAPVEQFRGGVAFKAHGLLSHSTLGSRVTKKKKKHLQAVIAGGAVSGVAAGACREAGRERD